MPPLDGSAVTPILLFLAAVAGGSLATYSYDPRMPPLARVADGLALGLAALGLVGFALAMRWGLTGIVIATSAVVVACPGALLLSARRRRVVSRDIGTAARIAVAWQSPGALLRAAAALAGAIVLWRVAVRTMYVRGDGIYTGVSHNIGDLPFHLTVINRFAYGNNFPPEHPSFAGVGFTYPFLTDFIAAVFLRAGLPVRDVIVWSTFLLCAAIAVLLYRWTLALTGRRDAAFLAPALALLSGGLGWWRFAVEAWRAGSPWSLLQALPHDYTITYDGAFRWGNLVTTLLVTQRGLLLGLPLALVVFRLWWQTIDAADEDGAADRARMIAAGVIAGMLPLVHAHTFAVVLAVGGCLAILFPPPLRWAPFFAWALALGLPQAWWVARASGVRSESFVAWAVGWDRGSQDVVVFWLRNTGLLIPLVVAALLWRSQPPLVPRRFLRFYAPFALCFIVPNLIRLAPWIWDNIKVLVYWFIASVPLVALVLAQLARGPRWRVAVAALLCASLTLAGALDLWRVTSGAFQSRIFDRDGIEFARIVAERTSPHALILHAPVPNHPIALTGRRSLMGYPGHVWSHGLDGGPREAAIRRIYAAGPDAAATLERYRIDYVVVGPIERFAGVVDEQFFERYPRAAEAGGYRLYRISGDQDQRPHR
jgi:hypothetical protein